MKSFKKFFAASLAIMHTLTFAAPAQVININEGTTVQVDSVLVNEGEQLSINVVDALGQVCPSCRGILETNNFLNNGAIDIWGILAIIAPTIVNNGSITVQGDLLLSNLGINKEQFFAGIAELSRDPSFANGYILNQGEITNLTEGLIALVAANGGVHNLGTISSNGGAVLLAAGDRAAFPLTRDGFLNIDLDGVTGVKGQVFDKDGNLLDTKGLVTNNGLIQANGGAVILAAAGAEAVFDSIINHTGIIEAKSVAEVDGKIVLSSKTGDIVVENATIDASGYGAGEKGGKISLLTDGNVIVNGSTVIDASGDVGGGEILIGADQNVTGDLTAKNVFVGSDVSVKADAVTTGNGGKIIVGADEIALVYGDFSATGGSESGNGGFIETSGKEYLDVDGVGINASAANGEAGTWLLDPVNLNVVASTGGSTKVNSISNDGFTTTFTSSITGVNHRTNVLASDIIGLLNAGTNVKLVTGAGTGDGNININAAITTAVVGGATVTLTLIAAGAITINQQIQATSGKLNFIATAAGGVVTIANSILTNGGNVEITGTSVSINQQVQTAGGDASFTATNGNVGIDNSVLTGGGDATFLASNNVTQTQQVQAGGGDVSFTATNGIVSIGNSVLTGGGKATFVAGTNITQTQQVQTSGGDASFTAGTNIDIDNSVDTDGGDATFLATGGNIDMDQVVHTGGGNASFTAANRIDIDNQLVTEGGSATFSSSIFRNTQNINTANVPNGGGDVMITADDASIDSFIIADSGAVFLKNKTAGTTFGLGSAAGDFQISNHEAGRLLADTVEIGTATAGNIQADSFESDAAPNLVLRTGSDVVGSGAGTNLYSSNLAVHAGGGVNFSEISVGTVAVSAVGDVVLNEQGSLNVGTVKGLSGISSSFGDVTIDAGSSLTLEQSVSAGSGRHVYLTSDTAEINQTGGVITANHLFFSAGDFVSLAQSGNTWNLISGSTQSGAINIADSGTNTRIDNLQTVGADINYDHTGAGDVTVEGFVTSGDGFTNGGNITINSSNALTVASTATLDSAIGAGGVFSAGAAVVELGSTVNVGAGNITLGGGATVLDTIINAPIVGAAAILLTALRDVIVSAEVTGPATTDMTITADTDLDGDGGVWLKSGADVNSDANLTITGSAINDAGANGESVRIDDGATVDAVGDITIQKSSVAPNTADIVINGVVTTSGSGKTIAIDSADELTTSVDGTANLVGDNIDLTTVNNINVEIDADNLFLETTAGDISVEDTLDGFSLEGFSNPGSGTLTLITHSPMTIAVDLIQAATINLSASESVDTDDHLIIDDNVTVQSTAGDVNLSAGDNVNVNTGALVKSDTGAVTITAGNGDTDNIGSISLGGLVSALTTVTLSALVGAITDTNAASNNVTANSLTATSLSGIDLDTTLTTLTNANVTGTGAIDISNTGALAVTSATTNDGAVTLNATGGNLDATTVTAGGAGRNVILSTTTSGDVNLGTVTATDDTVTVNSAGKIQELVNDDAGVPTSEIVAGTIQLNSSDDIGASSSYLDIQPSVKWGADSNGNDIFINCIGDCPIDQVNLGTSTFHFSTTGALTDGNDSVIGEFNGGTWNITAGGINIRTGTGFGTDTNPLELRLSDFSGAANADGRLAIDGGTGGVYATNAAQTGAGLTIGGIAGSFVDGIAAQDGIAIYSGSPLTVAADVVETMGGNILLAALGTALTDNLTVNSGVNVSATGGTGNVSLVAGNDVTLNSTANVSADSTGTVTVVAGEDFTDATFDQDGNANGSVSMTSDATVTSAAGNIFLDAAKDISIGLVSAVAGAANFLARSGSITDNNAATNNVSASSLDATAATGIDLDTTITTLTNANVTGAGAIDISNTGAMNVVSATTNNGNITLAADGGDLDLVSVVAGVPGAGDGDVTLTTTTSGNVNVGDVQARGDDITVVSAGLIEELGADNTADLRSNTMNLQSVSGIGTLGTLEINATTLTNASVSGAGSIDLLDVNNSLTVTNATTFNGDINLTADNGDLNLVSVVAGAPGAGDGNVSLTTTTGGNVNAGDVQARGDNITVVSAGLIEELGSDNVADLRSNTMDLQAVSGIGTLGTLEINATTLTNASVSAAGAIDLLDVNNGLVVTNATTFDGGISITADNGNLTAMNVVAGGTGDVNLATTASGDIFLETVSALDNVATITSAGTIQEFTNDDAGVQHSDVNAGIINLTTGGGDIGAIVSFLDITPTDLWNANSNGGDIYISCIGVCPMGQVDAGTGFFYYSGNITDGNDVVNGELAGGVWNITAGGVHLDADNDPAGFIGAVNNWIEMRLARDLVVADPAVDADGILVAAAGTGGVHVSNDVPSDDTLGLQVGSVGAFPLAGGMLDGVHSAGAIEIHSFSPLVIAANVVAGANLGLHANGNLATDDLTVNAGVNVQTTGANNTLDLTAGDTVNVAAGATIQNNGSGQTNLLGGESFTDLTINQDGNAGGDVTIQDTATVVSGTGKIVLDARDSVQVTGVSTGNTGDAINVIARTGNVTDGGDTNADLTAGGATGRATINAATGVGSGNAIETNIGQLDVTNTASGNIQVDEIAVGDRLDIIKSLQSAANGETTIRTLGGRLTVVSNGNGGSGVSGQAGEMLLEATGGNLAVQNTVTSTTGKINLDALTGNANFTQGGDVTATGGAEIEVFANGSISMNDGTVFNANGGGTGGASGDVGVGIDMDAANGDITLGSVQTTSSASTSRGDANDAVSINALNGAVIDGGDTFVDIIADSGETQISAANGVGNGNALEVHLDRLDVTNSTAGNIQIDEQVAGDRLDIVRSSQSAPTGETTIRTLGGRLTVLNAANGGLGVIGLAGEILLEATGGNLAVRNAVTSTTGKINLDALTNNANFSQAGDVTATGGAEIEVFAFNDINMADGTVFNANGGGTGGASGDIGVGIDMDAQNGSITLGSVQTTSTASTSRGDANDAVSINALNGAVIDGGDTDDDIIANAGETEINAANGIGHGNSLDVQLDRLDATNSTANDIDLREQVAGGALNIVRIDQNAAGGRIDIQTLDGTLTVLSEAVGGNAGNGVEGLDGEIFLRANGAGNDDDLVLNNQIESTTGKMNFDSTSRDVIADAEGDATATGGAEIESDAFRNITMADGTVWNANGGGAQGGIDLDARDGDITLGSVQTTSTLDHAVVIFAKNGKIIDGGDTDVDITSGASTVGVSGSGGGMLLKAKTGIGSIGTGVNVDPNNAGNNFATDALDTQGGRIAAQTESGDIQISNTGHLEITTLTDNDGGSSQSAPGARTVEGILIDDPLSIDPNSIIFVTTHSPMTVSSTVINRDGGNISLYALGGLATDTMTINANVQSLNTNGAPTGNGDIRLVSGGAMTTGAGVNISTQNDGVTSGTGRVAIGAGFDATGKAADASIDVNPSFAPDTIPGLSPVSLASTSTAPGGSLLDTAGDTGASLTMDETSTVSTESGRIIVDAQNNFIVGRVDADGNAGANGITDGTRGNILAFARNGSILDAEGPGEVGNLDFLANSLTLLAAGTIGLSSNHIEGDAPFLNTFSMGSQFVDILGDTQVEMVSEDGSIFLTATGDVLLGHVLAEDGIASIHAGSSIFSQGGGETRVLGFNLIELVAGGVIGTTSNPIHTHLNATPAQMNLSAAGQAPNGVSIAVFGNVSPAAINFLTNPPGLALFNGAPIAGQTLSSLVGNQSSLYYKAFVRGLRQYNDFDGNYAADFPGFMNYDSMSFVPDLSVDTTALELPITGVTTAPRVVPIPAPAVPTPVPAETEQTTQDTELQDQEPTPPAVVPIPANAVASDQATTEEGVPETPAATN